MNSNSVAMDTLENVFESGAWPSRERDWRAQALAKLQHDGFPTKRQEAWKYTDLSDLGETPWTAAIISEDAVPDVALLPDTDRVVYINGIFDAARSSLGALPEGVELDPERVVAPARPAVDAMSGLNVALARHGLYLRVADGVALPRPLEVVNLTSAGARGGMHHVRHHVELGASASVTLLDQTLSHEAMALSTQGWELTLGAGSTLNFTRLQDTADTHKAIDRITAEVAADAELTINLLELGARPGRLDLDINLVGERASTSVGSLLYAVGKSHVDHQIRIDHQAPNCSSRTVGRALAQDRGRVVLDALVHVARGADGTDSDQQLASLLLTPGAEANVKPELEIYADDVACAHGSTVGQLDDDAEVYLRTRGLSRDEARALLTQSFVRPALQRVPAAFRPTVRRHLVDRLPGADAMEDFA